MQPVKLLLRVASKLRDAMHQVATQDGIHDFLSGLEHCQRALREARRRVDMARQLRLTRVMTDLQAAVLICVRDLYDSAADAARNLARPTPTAPSLRFLLEELRQIEADFGNLTIDWQTKAINVTTEPITLKDVYLGPFEIRFFWERLTRTTDDFCFDVVALDPHPPDASEDVTHPHVKRSKLCPGAAKKPLENALEQGRLADGFTLVRSVLVTYNPNSPHAALEEWSGARCHDCQCALPEDDRNFCEACSRDYCQDCASFCWSCDCLRCTHCLELCQVCQRGSCQSCLALTQASRRRCCTDCRRVCSDCEAVFARDEQEQGTSLCPACRSVAPPAPGDASTTEPMPNTSPDSISEEELHATSLESDTASPHAA
jgi:hypothetical protein